MSKEEDLIRQMFGCYKKYKHQLNDVYESDCEIVEIAGTTTLINIDEFSEEDHFREHDPFSLGWNVCAGAMSDIFAAGGKVLFGGHSLVVKESWTDEYILEFNKGVSAALDQGGAAFIGGDFGKSPIWRCTTTVVGLPHHRPVTRRGAKVGDAIFITGKIGSGNVEALLKRMGEKAGCRRFISAFKNRFEIRVKEAELVSKYASACIDTSDGSFNCVKTLATQSQVGFRIDQLPLVRTGIIATKLAKIPPILLFLAEAGEYELLFTLPQAEVETFTKEAEQKEASYFRIGEIVDKGNYTAYYKNFLYDFSDFSIRARDYKSVSEYVNNLIKWTDQQHG